MARSYGRVLSSIWSDPDWVALSQRAQHCYMLLLSQPKLTLVGLLDYLPSRWARLAADTSLDSIEAAIHDLEASRLLVVDRNTDELLIRTFVRHDMTGTNTANTKLLKGLWSAWESVASPSLRHEIVLQLPASVWDNTNVPPPAEATQMRKSDRIEPPNPNDEPNGRTEPYEQNLLEPEAVNRQPSTVNADADLKQPGYLPPGAHEPAAAAAAVDNSNVRLSDDQRQQRLTQAVDLLVDRELDRNPTRGPSVERHRSGIRRGKLTDHHQRGHQLIAANPDVTVEALANQLEPPPAPPAGPPKRPDVAALEETQAAQLKRADAGTGHIRQILDEDPNWDAGSPGIAAARQNLHAPPQDQP